MSANIQLSTLCAKPPCQAVVIDFTSMPGHAPFLAFTYVKNDVGWPHSAYILSCPRQQGFQTAAQAFLDLSLKGLKAIGPIDCREAFSNILEHDAKRYGPQYFSLIANYLKALFKVRPDFSA